MEFNSETPTVNFKIQQKIFTIPKPFDEGHVCTAGEAGALNQTLAENTRNSWNTRIKEAVADESFNQEELQAAIDEYLETYEFGVRRGRGPADPVEREALTIAVGMVKEALRRKGWKIADVAADDISRLAEEAIAADENITKIAQRRVAEKAELGANQLDLSSISKAA